ncbi:MAG TPA: MASE1 domain-containing protein [Acidobacteriota bacterium]|nr:MASE1 domain-containing protein [Acidobacteriota bacterium]
MTESSDSNHPRRDAPRVLLWAPLVAVAYFAAAKFGLALAVVHPSASAVWPPAGISVAAFLLLGPRVWPAIAIAAFAANVTTAGSPLTSAGIATGNTLEGLCGAWLVGRFAGGRLAFQSATGVFAFTGYAALASTVVSATIGVTSLSLGGFAPWAEFGPIWTTWWLGDAVGVLVVAPPILLWATSKPPRAPRRVVEAAAVFLLFLVTAFLFFGGVGVKNAPIGWFWIPVVIWVAYRFGRRAATTMVLGIYGVTLAGTLRGFGPFALPSANVSLLLLQGFLGVVSLSALALAAIVASRERTMRELERARDDLEERVRQRTLDLTRANESLRDQILERLRLEMALLDAGERERQRLGRDLHDDLGQLLTGIGFLSSAVEEKLSSQDRPETRAVKEIRGLVQEAISKTRVLSLGLTPVSLGPGGLRDALRDLAESTERTFDVTCTFAWDVGIAVPRAGAATNLYRIAQEAISNAVRHGGCRAVELSMALEDDRLRLTIQDDGAGLPSRAGGREGLGLGIMKHRADLLGGALEVRSDAEGTTVVCNVPREGWFESSSGSAGPGS